MANLVTTGMAQEMGPLMAAVIMAGRTGAAFAAELGTMQVNQETDALRTLAVDPIQFLVVPRMLALMMMLPLLACYAILMEIWAAASRRVLGNAAHALAGMMRHAVPQPATADKPALGLTMFGVTTPCVQAVVKALDADHSSLFSGTQSKVVHHSTKARWPSVTGVTRKVAPLQLQLREDPVLSPQLPRSTSLKLSMRSRR